MRIALVISDLGAGGAQRVMTMLAGEWTARGHDVHLLSLHRGPDGGFYPVSAAVRVEQLALPAGASGGAAKLARNLGRIRTLRRAFRRLEPDVVVSFIDQSNVVALLAALGTRIPVVVSERTDPRKMASGRLWRLLCRLTYPLARCLVVQTPEIAALYAGGRMRSVATIPNPVYPPPAAPPQDSSGLPSPYVLAVGRLSREKGIDLLLEAFADVAPRFPDWTLAIAGDGPERHALAAQSRRLGIADRCVFLGTVRDIAGVLQGAALFVLPSRFEGFPNALCEAMAAGVACIATDCPSGPRNILRHDTDGILVPAERVDALAQALAALMDDPAARRRLGDAARGIVERFSVARVLSQWDAVLQEATAG